MTKKNNRPEFKDKHFTCCVCDSEDTVALKRGSSWFVWCACGSVSAQTNDTLCDEKEIFNFFKGTKEPYFAFET